jgi:hypothetical protein
MANLEVLALDPTAPQIEAPQTGNGYSMPRLVNITPEAVTGTATTPSVAVAQTWNTTGTPTALQVNVTDTASNAASKLLDLQVGGVSKFSVDKIGSAAFNRTVYSGTDVFSIASHNNSPVFTISSGSGYNNVSSTVAKSLNCDYISVGVTSISGSNFIIAPNNYGINFSNGSTADLWVGRDAANTLAQRNGVNAQTFNLYNTYTSGSVYERVSLSAQGTYFNLAPSTTGATLRPLLISHGATAYAALPAASTCEGARAYVTDSVLNTFGAIVAGGGANKTVVWSNGTNWLVG